MHKSVGFGRASINSLLTRSEDTGRRSIIIAGIPIDDERDAASVVHGR